MSAAGASDVIMRLAPTGDDAIPNAHPVYLAGLVRLAGLSGDGKWLQRADQLFTTLAPFVRANFVGHAGILNALDLRLHGIEIVTAGPERQALYEAALAIPFDHRMVFDLDVNTPLPEDHAAAAQANIAGAAAAFVCSGGTCSLPAHDVAGLEALVASE
jgi:hypothetical protein